MDIIGLSSTTLTYLASKAMEFGEKNAKLGLLRSSRSFKVIEVGITRKPVCDFLLVINSHWYPNDVHIGLIEKRVLDFLLVLIELFFATCYAWDATSDYRFKIGAFAPTGAGWPKISGIRGRPHQLLFFSENHAKWSFAWYKNLDTSFFHFVTIHAFDRRTDGQTDRHLSHR